ncbi:MAG: ABC transporter permease [Synergistaceae bacterium]|jgi:peptide/nickel transport system permease protein|nr:ABC transporter permease [Synergistaceae bacterium]
MSDTVRKDSAPLSGLTGEQEPKFPEQVDGSSRKSGGFLADSAERLFENRLVVASAVVLLVLSILAVFAPLLAPYDPAGQVLSDSLQGPRANHLLGTDEMGRDILSRIIYGTRISLSVGIVSQLIACVIGVLLGSIAGFYGGLTDTVISRSIEIFSAFPELLFAIGIMFVLGPGVINVFIALGLLSWTSYARLVRGQVMQLREMEYTQACIVCGGSNARIIVRHLLPNCFSTIIVLVTLGIPGAILTEASLSYIGLGVQPPTASWGQMISTAQQYISFYPFYSIAPGVAIIITVLAFNIFGDGLRDALDPRLRV